MMLMTKKEVRARRKQGIIKGPCKGIAPSDEGNEQVMT